MQLFFNVALFIIVKGILSFSYVTYEVCEKCEEISCPTSTVCINVLLIIS